MMPICPENCLVYEAAEFHLAQELPLEERRIFTHIRDGNIETALDLIKLMRRSGYVPPRIIDTCHRLQEGIFGVDVTS